MLDAFNRSRSFVDRVFFYLCCLASFLVLKPLLLPVATGIVLGYLSERPLSWLEQKLRVRRAWARWTLTIVFVGLVIAAFMGPVLGALYSASKELIIIITEQLGDDHGAAKLGSILQRVSDFVQHGAARLRLPTSATDVAGLQPRLRSGALSGATYVLEKLTNLAQATPGALFATAVALFTWVVAAVEGKTARERLLPQLIPWERPRHILTTVTAEVLRGLIVANLLVSAVQSVLCILALGLLRVPRFFVWGVLAFFLSFVPVIGTTVITLGAAGYLFSSGRYVSGVVMLGVAVLIGSIDNILRPLFMQGSIRLGFFWIFMSLVGGLAMFGVAGSVLGPLAVSLCVAALRVLEENSPPLAQKS